MCVIIYQPKAAHLKKDRAKRLWDQNPNGGGFTYVENEEVQIQKYMHFNEFWRAFETTRSRLPKEEFLIHMRIATHGSVNLDNTHPFIVDKHTVMVHNGIFGGLGDEDKSDTRVFIEEILPELPDNWMDNKVLSAMVEAYIGYNKIAFLTTDKSRKLSVYIVGERQGTWIDKMWFSNTIKVNPPVIVNTPKVWKTAARVPYVHSQQAQAKNVVIDDTLVVLPTVLEEPTLEAKVLEESIIVELRADQGLFASVVMSTWGLGWLCYGCDEEVNERTGECHCWNKVCLDCYDMAATCKCRSWSSNLQYYDELTPSEKTAFIELFKGDTHDLPKETQEVSTEMGVVPAGASNTSETKRLTTTVEA